MCSCVCLDMRMTANNFLFPLIVCVGFLTSIFFFFTGFENIIEPFTVGPGSLCPPQSINLIDEMGPWQAFFQSPLPCLSLPSPLLLITGLLLQAPFQWKVPIHFSLQAFAPSLNSGLFRAQWLSDCWCSYNTLAIHSAPPTHSKLLTNNSSAWKSIHNTAAHTF